MISLNESIEKVFDLCYESNCQLVEKERGGRDTPPHLKTFDSESKKSWTQESQTNQLSQPRSTIQLKASVHQLSKDVLSIVNRATKDMQLLFSNPNFSKPINSPFAMYFNSVDEMTKRLKDFHPSGSIPEAEEDLEGDDEVEVTEAEEDNVLATINALTEYAEAGEDVDGDELTSLEYDNVVELVSKYAVDSANTCFSIKM